MKKIFHGILLGMFMVLFINCVMADPTPTPLPFPPYRPIIGMIPDVWIGDEEDNVGEDINFFRFSKAFNFDVYHSPIPDAPDLATTNMRWSFMADDPNLITINGITSLSDPSEAMKPELVGKELTGYPNNNPPEGYVGTTPYRSTSWADFYDLKDSPPGHGPPWTDPIESNALDTVVTIYLSCGWAVSSTAIYVKANVEDGVAELPDFLSGPGVIHVITYDSPATQGWTKTLDIADGNQIANSSGDPFYVAPHVTDGGSVGASGSTTQNVWGSWESPDTDVVYFSNHVYQVKYRIRSDQTDINRVPNCRLLTECVGTGILAVSGGNRVGKGLFAPDADGEWYTIYLEPPELTPAGVTNLKFKFELIDFDANEEGTNYLDEVQVYRFETPSCASGTPVTAFTSQAEFASAGWSPQILGSPFGDATVGSNSTGLYIDTPQTVIAPVPGNIDYGLWQLPAGPSIVFESDRLYRCVYTLQSPDQTTLGKIRLINANAGGDWSSQLALVSDQTQVHMPDIDGEEYSNWFESMPALYTGADEYKNRMSFMFDVADGQNTQHGTVYLTKVGLIYYYIP